MIEIRKILYPTDFSECSETALAYAIDFAREYGAKLTVLHVVQVPDPYGPYEAWAFNRHAVEEQLLEVSRQHIAEQLEGKVPMGVEVDVQTAAGLPSRVIVDLAERDAYDLLVVGTHGRGGFTHIIMGSVAERVVRHAPCPVLTVRQTARMPGTEGDAPEDEAEPESVDVSP